MCLLSHNLHSTGWEKNMYHKKKNLWAKIKQEWGFCVREWDCNSRRWFGKASRKKMKSGRKWRASSRKVVEKPQPFRSEGPRRMARAAAADASCDWPAPSACGWMSLLWLSRSLLFRLLWVLNQELRVKHYHLLLKVTLIVQVRDTEE